MDNSVEDVLLDGYKIWRKNFILFVPFLCEFLIAMILAAILLLFLFFMFFSAVAEFSLWKILLTFFVVLVIAIAYGLVRAFFTAGAIGMAKEVLLKGNTNLQDMLLYGKKKFLTLFLFYLIFLLLAIPAVVFLFLQILTSIDLASIYIFAISLLLAPVPYAIVISNTSTLDGIKKGFKFIKENKLSFLLLYFFINFIEYAFTIVVIAFAFIFFIAISGFTLPSIPSFESIVMNAETISSSIIIAAILALIFLLLLYLAISIFVISPLINLWFTKLYADRTENLK